MAEEDTDGKGGGVQGLCGLAVRLHEASLGPRALSQDLSQCLLEDSLESSQQDCSK